MSTKKSSLRFIVTVIVILVSVFGLLIYLQNIQKEKNLEKAKNQEPITYEFQKEDLQNQPFLGDPNAPITMVEFFDVKCPACKHWEETVLPILKERYIDTGIAKVYLINFPLRFHGEEALLGASAIESAYHQKPEFASLLYDQIFATQNQYDAKQSTKLTIDSIKTLAKNVPGLDTETLSQDLQNNVFKEEMDRDLDLVKKANVNSTPTLYIQNQLITELDEKTGEVVSNAFNLKEIETIIRKELDEQNE